MITALSNLNTSFDTDPLEDLSTLHDVELRTVPFNNVGLVGGNEL